MNNLVLCRFLSVCVVVCAVSCLFFGLVDAIRGAGLHWKQKATDAVKQAKDLEDQLEKLHRQAEEGQVMDSEHWFKGIDVQKQRASDK